MKNKILAFILICTLSSGCGCLSSRKFDAATTIIYRDSIVFIPSATIIDTIRAETVRVDTLTKIVTIRIKADDTLKVTEKNGLRITTKIGRLGIVTEAVKLDTSIILQNKYTEKIVYMTEPAKDRWAWWKWVSIGFAAGLILALSLAKR